MPSGPCGRSIVVDLGFTAPSLEEEARTASLGVVQRFGRLGFDVSNRLYEHSHAVDDQGYLSMGYALEVAQTCFARRPLSSRRCRRLPYRSTS